MLIPTIAPGNRLKRVTVLFTSTHETSFILEDLNLLRRNFSVVQLRTTGLRWLGSYALHLLTSDVTFTWFATVYAWPVVALARFMGKHSIVTVGGADAAKIEALDYGIWRSKWKSFFVRRVFRHAWRIVPVDESLSIAARALAAYDGKNISVIPIGVDAEFWKPEGVKEQFVLSVAAVESVGRLNVKGVKVLCEAARLLPHVQFLIVGIRPDLLARAGVSAPSNLRMEPRMSREELRRVYQQASVYCQASYSEGMPSAVCEAMLCGCIPVATEVGGTERLISDAGYLVPPGDPTRLAAAIDEALKAPDALRVRARTHIATTYPLARREKALRQLIEEAIA